MLEYKIVSANSLANLEANVNIYLAQGWELYGEVHIIYPNPATNTLDKSTIFQVMTKTKFT